MYYWGKHMKHTYPENLRKLCFTIEKWGDLLLCFSGRNMPFGAGVPLTKYYSKFSKQDFVSDYKIPII